MDFRFVQIAQEMWSGKNDGEPVLLVEPTSERRQESDESILTKMKATFESSDLSPERKVQQISIAARNSQSTNNIQMNSDPIQQEKEASSNPEVVSPVRRNVGIMQPGGVGTLVLYLKSGDYLKAIRENKDAKRKEEEYKAACRERREENKKRRLEKTLFSLQSDV